MNSISRTVPTSTVKYARVSVMDGKIVGGEPLTVTIKGEEADEKRAMTAIREQEHDKVGKYMILDITVSNVLYAATLPDFMAVAKIVPAPTAEQIAASEKRKADRAAKAAAKEAATVPA